METLCQEDDVRCMETDGDICQGRRGLPFLYRSSRIVEGTYYLELIPTYSVPTISIFFNYSSLHSHLMLGCPNGDVGTPGEVATKPNPGRVLSGT